MTEEKPFHFEVTTDDVPVSVEFPVSENRPEVETVKALLRAVGIQPGIATVTLGSEKKQDN